MAVVYTNHARPADTIGETMLDICDLTRRYGAVTALDAASLHVPDATIVAVLGGSGCGKSTLLRLVAGLEPPDGGSIGFRGRPLAGVPPHLRQIGMVFQDYALFPHLDVAGNVAFGLHERRLTPAARTARVATLLDLVGLAGYGPRQIATLSGGERQRVALARCLAPQPALVLLDEPLAALDRTLRDRLVGELATVLRRVGVSALYVTHDQDEAFGLADRLVIMERGRVLQTGAPELVYGQPASVAVARFLGQRNLLPARVRSAEGARGVVRSALGDHVLPLPPGSRVGDHVTCIVRAEGITWHDGVVGGSLPARVLQRRFAGSRVALEVALTDAGLTLGCELSGIAAPAVGAVGWVSIHPAALWCCPAEPGSAPTPDP